MSQKTPSFSPPSLPRPLSGRLSTKLLFLASLTSLFSRSFAGARFVLKRVKSSFDTLRNSFRSAPVSANTNRSNPFRFRPAENPDGAEGSKFWKVSHEEAAHWAAIRRMMRTEARWKTRRNTRGLPLGTGRHMTSIETTEALNRQAKARASRPSKFARLVASLNSCAPVRGLEVQYRRRRVTVINCDPIFYSVD